MAYRLLKPLRLFILGAPGSGKGTQTSRLLRLFPQILTISSGDMLRKQIKDKTSLGSLATSYISQGKLLPDDLITRLVTSHLAESDGLSANSTWLLDGFPRTLNQAKMLENELAKSDANLTLVVELDVPEKVILERIENRYVHIRSGRIYNLQYNPPRIFGRDDVTGEPLTKRPDDTIEVFNRRLIEYKSTVTPLKEYYAKKGILKTISGQTSDIIFPKFSKLIETEYGIR